MGTIASPTNLVPGEVINLPMKDNVKLGGFIIEMVQSLEDEYREYISTDIPVWWKWYFAEPAQREKNFPFRGASNIVVPLIRTMSDADTATTFGKVFAAAPRVWSVKSNNESPEFQEFSRSWDEHMRYAPEHDFGLKVPVYDWLHERSVVGTSVMALNWHWDRRHVFFGKNAKSKNNVKSQLVEWSRGVNITHVPREYMLWDTQFEIHKAPVVSRQHEYAQWQLEQMAMADSAFNKEVVFEKIKGQEGTYSSIAQAAQDAKNMHESRQKTVSRDPNFQSHDIREVHIDFPLVSAAGIKLPNEDGANKRAPWIPLVAHVHRESGLILRLVAAPYHIPDKPFYAAQYRRVSGRGISVGLAKRLKPLAEMQTTTANQAIDSATRMNALWAVTRDKRLSQALIDVSRPLYTPDIDGFRELNVNTQFVNNLPLLQMAQTLAERDAGIADPLLGRETRHGGHPAPATSTLALMGQQDKMSLASDEILRDTMSRLGRDITILYQQYETNDDGKYDILHGERDAQNLKAIIFPNVPIPSNFIFDVAAMSPNMNPDTEMRRAVFINQMTNDYWSFVLKTLQTAYANPNVAPQIMPAIMKSLQSKTKVYETFLEASNIDDIQQFILELNQEGGAGDPGQFQRIAGVAQEAAQSAGAVPQPGTTRGPGASATVGAASPSPQGGVLLQ